MSSATTIDFQIANTANLEKIERFMNASVYQQNLEYSANFNTRLCVERRLRLPFLDPQTGVAQNHCSLFMTRRQRMPGFREGQLYTYPGSISRYSLQCIFEQFIYFPRSRLHSESNSKVIAICRNEYYIMFLPFSLSVIIYSESLAKTWTTIFNENAATIRWFTVSDEYQQ